MSKPLKAYIANVYGSVIVFARSPAEAQERASQHAIEAFSPNNDFPAGENFSIAHKGLFASRVMRYYGEVTMPIYDTVEEAEMAWVQFQREVSNSQERFQQWQTNSQ